jgi:hypothetical protein
MGKIRRVKGRMWYIQGRLGRPRLDWSPAGQKVLVFLVVQNIHTDGPSSTTTSSISKSQLEGGDGEKLLSGFLAFLARHDDRKARGFHIQMHAMCMAIPKIKGVPWSESVSKNSLGQTQGQLRTTPKLS